MGKGTTPRTERDTKGRNHYDSPATGTRRDPQGGCPHWATAHVPGSSGVRGHCRHSPCTWPAQCSATDITILDRLQIIERQPRQFAWLLHRCGSLLSLPEPNQRPLDYLHATRRLYGHALPFWWNGSDLVQTADIDQLIARMQAACAELHHKTDELHRNACTAKDE